MVYLCQRAKRTELLGKNERDVVQMVVLNGVLADTHKYVLKGLVENKGDEKLKQGVLKEKLHPKLEELSRYLGRKEYFLGYLTAFDVGFYVLSDILAKYDKASLERYENFVRWKGRMESVPEIKGALKKSSNQ